jgi:mycothiol synthase
MKIFFWLAWEGADRAVGNAVIHLAMTDNLHIADFNISVLPEFRRRGLGRQFLANIVQKAQEHDRRLMIASSMSTAPDGEGFLTHIGAEAKMPTHINQLKISELDRALLADWQAQAAERAGGFELGWWIGAYPNDDMAGILTLHELVSQQPFDDLEIETFKITEKEIRQRETSIFSRGYERWTLFVREKSSARFAGYTEVLWNPNRPEIIYQDMTGVFPEFRNRGLGRWLKATMLVKILAERPYARFVRTGNADSNAPMLKINNELGFKPYIAESIWQLETEKAAEYLEVQ